MDYPADQIAELKSLFGNIQWAREAGGEFLLIPQLPLPIGCEPHRVDALLCPTPRDGYSSRLFLAEKPTSGSKPNWNGQIRILERNWFAFSWKINSPRPIRLAQMVQMHLKGLR